MAKIKSIKAREILASGGEPSIEAVVTLEGGAVGEASVPYGASAGSREAKVVFDKDERYHGRGMLKAIGNIGKITKLLVGCEAGNQRTIDQTMISLDGTEDKSRLGGNATLAVSLSVARAQASAEKVPLYQYLRQTYELENEIKLPKPMVVMIEGGKHASNSTDLQEYLVSTLPGKTAKEAVRMEMEIYQELKIILKTERLSTNVGNEGAFASEGIASNEKPLEYLFSAIEKAGYRAGTDAGLSIDAAANEFCQPDLKSPTVNYKLVIEKRTLTSPELIEYFLQWAKKYPIVTMEDMLAENDWGHWVNLTEKLGNIKNIADDLTVTNTKLLQKAIDMKAASGIIIKLNQAGTLSETVDCCLLAKQNDFMMICSHRGGGETNDTFMVDLAVATGCDYLKVGPTRGERVEKYNRLMRIEEELGV